MKSELKDISATKKSLHVVVPAEEVEEKVKDTLGQLVKTVSLPGFRPGKAPASMLRARFKKEIREEVIGELVPRYIREGLKEAGVEPVRDPKVEEVDFRDREPLAFTATFEVVPDFDLPIYKGLEFKKEKVVAGEEELNSILESMRDDAGTWVPVENRSPADGDLLSLELEIRFREEGRKPVTHKDLPFVVGDTNLPEPVIDLIRRLEAGGSGTTGTFTYPADWYDSALAGAEADVTVTVKEIKEKERPDLDDAFAVQLAGRFGMKDVKDMKGFREAVKADLLKEKEARRERELRERALAVPAAEVEVEIPQGLVDQELQYRLEDIAMNLQSRGMDVGEMDIQWDKVREEQREPAVAAVKEQILARRIAREEDIAVTDKDLDAKLAEHARRSGESLDELKERLVEDGRLTRIREQMTRDAVVDFVLANATITEEA